MYIKSAQFLVKQVICLKLVTYSVKPVINEMFEILAHSNLSHQFILVSVHSCQLANMGKDVLQAI